MAPAHPGRRMIRGFSLIEMVITVLIAAILLRLAMPSFINWIGNLHIRSAAEAVVQGLSVARNEALRRNARVMFQMAGANGGESAWAVCQVTTGDVVCDPAVATIQTRDGGEESGRARVGASTDVALTLPGAFGTPLSAGAGMPAAVIFDGRGRPITQAGWNNTVRFDVRNTAVPVNGERRLVVTVSATGSARMCDPQASAAGDPRIC